MDELPLEVNVSVSEKARKVPECPKERERDAPPLPHMTIEAIEDEESSGKIPPKSSMKCKKQFPAADLHTHQCNHHHALSGAMSVSNSNAERTQSKTLEVKLVGVPGDQELTGGSVDQGGSSRDISRDCGKVDVILHCNCGHKGPIASHLRSNQQCVLGIREELFLGSEMSNEVLIVQATLILGGCPAVGCLGGSHAEMPDRCLSWWRLVGCNLMKWEGLGSDVNCSVVQEIINSFVKEKTEGYEQQDQYKHKNINTTMLSRGNLEYRPMEDPDAIFAPPITSTQV